MTAVTGGLMAKSTSISKMIRTVSQGDGTRVKLKSQGSKFARRNTACPRIKILNQKVETKNVTAKTEPALVR